MAYIIDGEQLGRPYVSAGQAESVCSAHDVYVHVLGTGDCLTFKQRVQCAVSYGTALPRMTIKADDIVTRTSASSGVITKGA